MKIRAIRTDYIKFNNNALITFDHDQDCCEYNYADFEYLRDEPGIMDYDFDEDNLKFEFVENAGFRFGDNRRMFFVPCYSEQNGYYTCNIDIYFRGQIVTFGECKEEYR